MRIENPDEWRDRPKRPGRAGRFLRGLRRSPEAPPRLRPAFRRPVSGRPVEREIDWRSYEPVAEDYARVQAPRTAEVARDVARQAGVRPGSRVLDVGTGTGVGARAASEAGAEVVVGIDMAHAMLVMARSQAGGPSYVQAAALDLPFRDATFSHVLAAFVLSHFQRFETAVFDMLRVLRPGGRMAVATWGAGRDEFGRAWDEVAEAFAGKEIMRDAYERSAPGTERFSDPARLKEALHDAGLRTIEIQRREYRFEMSAEDYLVAREIAATGRFLHQMLGERLWETFRRRTREAFAERFPPRFNDFRDVILAAGRKPQ